MSTSAESEHSDGGERAGGAAALNLTEVAARVGLRQRTLYQYFSSRNAVYDAWFEWGRRQHA